MEKVHKLVTETKMGHLKSCWHLECFDLFYLFEFKTNFGSEALLKLKQDNFTTFKLFSLS